MSLHSCQQELPWRPHSYARVCAQTSFPAQATSWPKGVGNVLFSFFFFFLEWPFTSHKKLIHVLSPEGYVDHTASRHPHFPHPFPFARLGGREGTRELQSDKEVVLWPVCVLYQACMLWHPRPRTSSGTHWLALGLQASTVVHVFAAPPSTRMLPPEAPAGSSSLLRSALLAWEISWNPWRQGRWGDWGLLKAAAKTVCILFFSFYLFICLFIGFASFIFDSKF